MMALTHSILQIGLSEPNVPFEMHTMQWIENNRWQQNSVPHKHSYFVIVWVKKGSGLHLIDVNKFELTENTVYCISPGQVHLLKANNDIDGYVISFTSDFICLAEENYDLLFKSGLFYEFSQPPIIKITSETVEELQGIAEKLLKEYENFFLLRSEVLRGYLKIFLIYLTRQFEQSRKQGNQSKNVQLVMNFLSLLEKNYLTMKMVSDYAAELAITPNYLNEIVKKVSGRPASEHIKHRIILEAKRHAIYFDTSLKEIAYSLGFDDTAHFSKYFKHATGMNFSDFKKNSGIFINQ